MDNIKWLQNLKSECCDFLSKMQQNNFSYFKYSYSGDLFEPNDNWGLANIVYAVKSLYTLGILNHLSNDQKNNLANAILKFSDKNGAIFDPVISSSGKKNFVAAVLDILRRIKNHNIKNNVRRSETKQAFAALYLLNRKPQLPYLDIPKDTPEVKVFIDKFNWSKPWHACAHFAILLFFLKYNEIFFKTYSRSLIHAAVQYVNSFQSKKDGCWYQGDHVSLNERINGAMKYLTGIHAAGIYDFSYADSLVDTALSGINSEHACNNLNIVYILYAANKIIPDYRRSEIEDFLLERIKVYKRFYHDEYGGFSFYENKANTALYGTTISRGLNEPDMHGTTLFLSGIAMIDDILKLDLGFKVPVF